MPATTADRPLALDHGLPGRLSDRYDEPAWLRDLRRSWWERHEATPMPTGSEEEWRRVSLAALPLESELLLQGGTDAPGQGSAGDEVAEPGAAGELNVHDGAARANRLDERWARAGVIFTDLATAVREHPDLVRPYLGTADSLPSHARFWALANAAWTGGTFLWVPPGVEVDAPFFVSAAQSRADVAHFPHTLVVVGENARAALVEEAAGPDAAEGAAGWTAGAVDVRAGDGSRVEYVNLQRLGRSTWNLGSQRIDVGQSAEVVALNVEVGSKITKLGIEARMAGKGGTSHLLGLIAAGDDQQIDINSLQDLSASHATSDLLYLSALYDRARAGFYGVIRVRPGALQTSSYQECRNLLLSPHAGAEPIPVLEIQTNDILRCGHGATAGAIDPTQLFYVRTRGLDADAAERLIVRGFFEQVLGRLAETAVRERMLAALAPRIGPAVLA